jgi:hypothetical protein
MDGEETTMSVIGRKYCPIKLQKRLVRQVWAATTPADWAIIVPFIIERT